jgi:hypothetical protein
MVLVKVQVSSSSGYQIKLGRRVQIHKLLEVADMIFTTGAAIAESSNRTSVGHPLMARRA